MANYQDYNPDDPTIVAVPAGMWEELKGQDILACTEETCIMVTVQDKGPLPGEDIDFSPAAFARLASLGRGRISVTWWAVAQPYFHIGG